MAERLTKQPLVIQRVELVELNDVLRRIQDELDLLNGLRGKIQVHDSYQYVDSNGQILHGHGVKPT